MSAQYNAVLLFISNSQRSGELIRDRRQNEHLPCVAIEATLPVALNLALIKVDLRIAGTYRSS